MADIVSGVTLYPWYRNADILAAADMLLTKVLIPINAVESGVKAFVDMYAKEIARLKIVGSYRGRIIRNPPQPVSASRMFQR